MNVPNHGNSKKNRVHRWTNIPDLLTNLILLKVQNHENSMENYVHQMYRSFGIVKKIEFVKSTNL